MRALRVVFVAMSLALLGYGIALERHEVRSLKDTAVQNVNGPAFADGATSDAFMRQDGRLFDVYSLTPGTLKEKDCKT